MAINIEKQMLREALGISGTDFELSVDDYYQLFLFDPTDYEGFKNSCNNVGAKWPSRSVFEQLDLRYMNSD